MTAAISDLREQVAQIEARRQIAVEAAAEAVERRQLEEKIKLGEIEEKEGLVDRDIKPIFSPKTGEMVVVRTPKAVEWQRFQTKVLSPKPVGLPDLYELIHACLVYPSRKDFERICDMSPGMLDSTVATIGQLKGEADEDAAGK